MMRTLLRCFCLVAVVAVAVQMHGLIAFGAPINVAVIAEDGGMSSAVQLAAQLNDDTFFDFTATVIPTSGADSAAELAPYGVVVLGGSGHTGNGYSAACLAALRTFLDSGGGVVTTGAYNFSQQSYTGQQDLDADYITPITTHNGQFDYAESPGTVNILSSAHPITSGISNYSFSGEIIELPASTDPGAVTLGTVVNRFGIAIAYRDSIGRSVYLGGLYMGNVADYQNSGLRTGVQDRLLEQAVNWANIPEPSTLVLLGLGAIGLLGRRRSK
jgi:PEP-CTERM motif